MKLHLLGTGGYHPNEVRHTPCFVLPELGVVFDAGTATFRLPPVVQTKHLDLFLTHPHWDHIIGLTYLLVPMLLNQIESVTVYGNEHTLGAIKTHLFAEPTFAHMPDFEFRLLNDFPEGIERQGCRIEWQALPSHHGGSVGYRLTWDNYRLAYITDTYVDGSYCDFIRGVDLLIHECYFADDMADWAEKTGHSYLSQVVKLAKDCDVGQLLLTHMDPRISQLAPFDLTEAQKVLPNLRFAEDLMTLDVGEK